MAVEGSSEVLEGSSDSEESLFSGLEESGSDSEEDEDEEEEEEEEEGVPGATADPDGGNSQVRRSEVTAVSYERLGSRVSVCEYRFV